MNTLKILIFFVFGYLMSFIVTAQESIHSAYYLSAGDTVSIHVYGQEALSVTAKIDNLGVINYPFIGEVALLGYTTQQVKSVITERLKDGYFISPEVHVSVAEYRPFYIHGQVNRPGSFAYQPGLTLSKAIAIAGGLTERASSKWIVERQDTPNKMIATEQTPILPGDIVTIKQSFF